MRGKSLCTVPYIIFLLNNDEESQRQIVLMAAEHAQAIFNEIHEIQMIDDLLAQMNKPTDLRWIQLDTIIIASIMDAWKHSGGGDISITEQAEDLLRELQAKYESSGNSKLQTNTKTLISSLGAWM